MERSKFAVIDKALIQRCIFVGQNADLEDRKPEEAEKIRAKTEMKNIEHLMFSFQNLHSISNLVGLSNLTKLQLDNNRIEVISGLDELPNLKWLDLSFNQIREIQGLGQLTKLTDLVLYCNQISSLEEGRGLRNLTQLECLSIGANQLEKFEEIICLRRFRKLKLLVVEGNPFCQKEEGEGFILAHLSKLRFLDYRLVSQEKVQEAQLRWRNNLLDLEAQDVKEREERRYAKEISKEEERYSQANMQGVVTLFDDMFESFPKKEVINELKPLLADQLESYRATFSEVRTSMANEVFNIYREEALETGDFDEVVEGANEAKNQEAKAMIKDFERRMKQTLLEVIHRSEEGPTREDEMKLISLKAENEKMAEKLLEMEVIRVEEYSTVYDEYVGVREGIKDQLVQTFRQGFEQLREKEKAFFAEMEAAVADGMDKAATEEGEEHLLKEIRLSERAVQLLRDKEQVSRILRDAHDTRIAIISAKGDELEKKEEEIFANLRPGIEEKDHRQNRARVTEIWMWVDRNSREIDEELEPIQKDLAENDPYQRY